MERDELIKIKNQIEDIDAYILSDAIDSKHLKEME